MASEALNIIIFLSLFQFSFVSSTSHVSDVAQRKTKRLQPTSFKYPKCESGYYNNSADLKGPRFFYYFFKERSDDTSPIMLWLTGVPGLSSCISLFHENGPYRINHDLTLSLRKYGWDKIAKIIYIDEPVGTGFSYISDESHIRRNTHQIINDLYNFLQEFFRLHPNYKYTDFFIAGQSYAGKYAPMLAYKIYEENKKYSNIYIHLKGVAIGNGLTNPKKQFSKIPKFCEDMRVIEHKYRPKIDEASDKCQSSISNCDRSGNIHSCSEAYTNCGLFLQTVAYYDGGKNLYDYTKNRVSYLYYDFSNVERYLNLEPVKNALGVEIKPFHLLNEEVYNALSTEYMRNSEHYVADLLNLDINVLIYTGDRDIISNVDGDWEWLSELEWNDKEEFEDASEGLFYVDDEGAGIQREYGSLRHVQVFDAGHMAGMDKPKVIFEMMEDWMKHARRTIR